MLCAIACAQALRRPIWPRYPAVAPSLEAFRRDAQPSEVQIFEPLLDLLGRQLLIEQPAPLPLIEGRERSVRATSGVSGATLEERRASAGDGLALEPGHDGA